MAREERSERRGLLTGGARSGGAALDAAAAAPHLEALQDPARSREAALNEVAGSAARSRSLHVAATGVAAALLLVLLRPWKGKAGGAPLGFDSMPVLAQANVSSIAAEYSTWMGPASVNGVCQDTPNWNNGWSACAYSQDGHDPTRCAVSPGAAWPATIGFTCSYYVSKGLCAPPNYKGFAMGPSLNWPERNCCACKDFKVKTTCNMDTMGTCYFSRKCNSWRGPTSCNGGRCHCKTGYCADSAGTCGQDSRSVAVRQKTAKATGQAVPTKAPCMTQTPGTCFRGSCSFWRGNAECRMTKCVCAEGYCVDKYGGCFKDMGDIKAPVFPVNSMRPAFPGAQVKVALTISGGGSRSHAAGLGYFRALRDLGLISKIDAISSVSGGTWASAILLFANQPLDTMLGPATNPQELTTTALDATPAPHGAVLMEQTNQIAMGLKLQGLPFGLLWVGTVAKAFLEPFGLNALDAFMAPSLKIAQDIKNLNPQYADTPFQVPVPGRAKTLVMGCTVEAPNAYVATDKNTHSLQVSPDWTGSPFYPDNTPVNYTSNILGKPPLSRVLVGGGFLATFAFGSTAPTSLKGQFGGRAVDMAAPVRPFSLARAVGMSSAAFGKAMCAVPGFGNYVNPQVPMWPVSSEMHPRPQKAMNFQIGDGNDLENTGLLAMLQRKATKVASLINSDVPLRMDIDFCLASSTTYQPTGTELTTQFSNFFGYASVASPGDLSFHSHNQVFLSAAYLPLLCELQTLKKAGKAQVIRKTLEVQQNSWWGIESGWSVDIIFCLLDTAEEFEKSLPADTQQALSSGLIGGLEKFPLMKTTFQNPPDLTQYKARQINLLAAQAEWAVQQNAQMFKDVLR